MARDSIKRAILTVRPESAHRDTITLIMWLALWLVLCIGSAALVPSLFNPDQPCEKNGALPWLRCDGAR